MKEPRPSSFLSLASCDANALRRSSSPAARRMEARAQCRAAGRSDGCGRSARATAIDPSIAESADELDEIHLRSRGLSETASALAQAAIEQ